METIIYKGYWWLPTSPDDKVAGALTVEPCGNLKLELFGGFGPDERFDFEREPDKVIYGRCYAPNEHMKDISLFECYSAISLNFSSDFPLTRYSCHYALIGFHTDSMRNPDFFEASVELAELARWCPPSNISTQIKDSSITVTLDHSEDKKTVASVVLDDGSTLKLNQGGSYKTEYPSVYFSQYTFLEVTKENMTGIDALIAAKKFERFLSLAMLSPVEHGRITLRSRKCFQMVDDNNPYYHPIELVTSLYRTERTSSTRRNNMLFTYDDVAMNLSEMYKRFHTEMNISQIWDNLIDSLEKKRVFTSNDFLVVIQALDGFSIRFREEQDFLPQLTALKDEFKDIKRLKLTDDDLKAARGSRNYYSHILKIEKKEQKQALEGGKLLDLTEKLRILLICCVLNFLGMDNEKINALLDKCNNQILQS